MESTEDDTIRLLKRISFNELLDKWRGVGPTLKQNDLLRESDWTQNEFLSAYVEYHKL